MLFTCTFTDLDTWKSSRKGNLWKTYNHRGRALTLTVFLRDDDRYSWCIADERGPEFSKRTFKSQQRAIDDLADHLDI